MPARDLDPARNMGPPRVAVLVVFSVVTSAFLPPSSSAPGRHVRVAAKVGHGFRDAQRELMDGGAEIELSGDALLEAAQSMDFLSASLEMRTPKCTAGVAVKNAGRSIADVGAKFRNKGGLELAAYAMDEAGVYMTECAKALRKMDDGVGTSAADVADDVADALSRTGKGLYEVSPDSTGAALLEAADHWDRLSVAFSKVEGMKDAGPRLVSGASRLRAGGRVLTGSPEAEAAPKKPRRW